MEPEDRDSGEDWETAQSCAQCSAPVALSSDRGFAFGIGNVLCWECALESRPVLCPADTDTVTLALRYVEGSSPATMEPPGMWLSAP